MMPPFKWQQDQSRSPPNAPADASPRPGPGHPGMKHWAWRLLAFGIAMTLVSAAPAVLIYLLPPLGDGFFGTLAILLTLTVTPLGVVVASAGAILLLVAVLRRGRI